jgi:hypothetical protein
MSADKRGSALRLVAALVLALWAQYSLLTRRDAPWDGIVLYALAMALFAYQLRLGQEREGGGLRRLFAQVLGDIWGALHHRPWRLGLMALGCGAVSYAAVAAVGRPISRPSFDLLAWWGLGLGAVLAAFADWQGLPARLRVAGRRLLSPEGMAVAALVALTVWLRAASLETIPPVLSGDEASLGLEALAVLDGRRGNPFATGWLSHPSLYFYVQAAFIRLFGVTTAALRFSSALVSGGVAAFLYLLVRRLFGRGCAVLATLYFALYHYAIHFGRLGLNNIWDPLWALGSLYLLTVGLEERRALPVLWAGLFSGLAVYFYLGARLVPVLVVVYLCFWAWRERGFWRRQLHAFVLWAGMALLAALPLLAHYRRYPDQLTARWRWVGIFPSGWVAAEMARTGQSMVTVLGGQFGKAVLAFHAIPDPTFWYRPERPLLFYLSAIFFVFGLTYCLVHWRQRANFLMLAWFLLVIAFGGMLLENPPSSPRLVMAIPPVVVLVALGMVQVAEWASPLWGRARAGVWLASMACVCLCGYQSLHFYFVIYTPQRMFSDDNTAVADAVGRYLRERGDGTVCYLLGAPRLYFGHATIPYLAPGAVGVDIIAPLQAADSLAPPPGAVFVILPERESELAVVQRWLPGGAIYRHLDARGRTLFISYASDE